MTRLRLLLLCLAGVLAACSLVSQEKTEVNISPPAETSAPAETTAPDTTTTTTEVATTTEPATTAEPAEPATTTTTTEPAATRVNLVQMASQGDSLTVQGGCVVIIGDSDSQGNRSEPVCEDVPVLPGNIQNSLIALEAECGVTVEVFSSRNFANDPDFITEVVTFC